MGTTELGYCAGIGRLEVLVSTVASCWNVKACGPAVAPGLEMVGEFVRASTLAPVPAPAGPSPARRVRSEEHTSELQSLRHLVCRLLLEKKKQQKHIEER